MNGESLNYRPIMGKIRCRRPAHWHNDTFLMEAFIDGRGHRRVATFCTTEGKWTSALRKMAREALYRNARK